MKRHAKVIFSISLLLTDVAMIVLAFFLAYELRLRIPWRMPAVNIGPLREYVGMMVVHALTMVTVFFFYRLYHHQRALSMIEEASSIFGAVSVGTIISVAMTSFFFRDLVVKLGYPWTMLMYSWLLTLFLVAVGRFAHSRAQRALQARGWGEDRLLIIGTSDVGQMIWQKIRYTPSLGYRVVGFIANGGGIEMNNHTTVDTPVLGTLEDIPRVIDEQAVNEVIIALPEAPRDQITTIISLCERGKVGIKVYPDVFQIMASHVSIGDLSGLPLLTVRDVALRGWRMTLKRAMDILFSAVALVVLSPFLLLVALLIKLDSPGPVFYAQERMGLDAKPFWCLKFRSMRQDAEADTGPVWAQRDDPRRTRLGAFMRRFSIDELPQFINVFVGNMSLVGPRPERPVFVEQFNRSIPRYMDRHREKAGITGWAQVNGLRGDTSIAERTKYDLWYIENWSLWLDIKILLRTFFLAFTDRNAY
ncbi:MAG: undecaprenyl-phosphate glucose phosphotransferase [Chloroflexota bacterium]|nr:undecaprenyl-phosphate glucose phosphotransferase [Chloroflexota bacterium]